MRQIGYLTECGSDEYNFREGDEDPWTEFKKWKREGEKNWNKEGGYDI